MPKHILRYSNDGAYYYVECPAAVGGFWLSSEPIPGSVPDSKKKSILSGFVEFTRAGRTYHREVLPFAYWKIKDNLKAKNIVSESDERYEDWMKHVNRPPSKFKDPTRN